MFHVKHQSFGTSNVLLGYKIFKVGSCL